MTSVLNARLTTQHSLTSTAENVNLVLTSPGVYRYYSNRASHVYVSKSGGDASVTNGMPVASDCAELINVGAGEIISVVRAAGETDGDFWLTKIS